VDRVKRLFSTRVARMSFPLLALALTLGSVPPVGDAQKRICGGQPSGTSGTGRDGSGACAAEMRRARSGTILGKLRGRGAWARSPGKHLVTVDTLAAETGKLAHSLQLSASRRFRLKVPAGFYVLMAEASDLKAGKTLRGNSHVVRVRRGRRARTIVRLTQTRGRRLAAGRPPDHSGLSQRAGVMGRREQPGLGRGRARGRVFTLSPGMRITRYPGLPRGLPLDDVLITDLVNGCPDTTVVVHPSERGPLLREIRLSNSRFADPATRLTPRFIEPGFEVRGGGSVSGGQISAQLSIVNLRSGRVVGRVSASGSLESFFEFLDELGRRLVEEVCPGAFPLRWEGTANGTITGQGFQESWQASFTLVRNFQDKGAAIYYASGGTMNWSVSGGSGGCTLSGSDTYSFAGGPSSTGLGIYNPPLAEYDLGIVERDFATVTESCPPPAGTKQNPYYNTLNISDPAVSGGQPWSAGLRSLAGSRTYQSRDDPEITVSWTWNLAAAD
jgi:hypothetical protein